MIAPGVTPRVRAGSLLAREWDAIVVGAGIGGLVCAALLATRARMRVLVLERHYEVGGLTQAFRRKRYAWEVGVHYVGDVGSGMPRRVLDLACGGRVAWTRLPAAHDRLIAPGIDARLGGERAAIRAQWLSLAPGEERAADRILDAIVECARAAPPHMLSRMRAGASPSERSPFLAWSDCTALDVVRDAGASPRLALLATYAWTDYGMPPDEASFASMAITTAHYLGGAFHPVGGGAALGHAMAATLAQHASAVVVRAEVARAIVQNGRALGVMLSDGTEVRAPIVVSDVGARGTFDWLAPGDEETRDRMRAIGPSSAHVGLYVGLPRAPRDAGFDGGNVFVVRDRPGEERRDSARWLAGDDEEPADLYASTACAVDPSFAERYPGRTALSLASAMSMSSFARWQREPHAHRGKDYEATKARLAESMLRVARRHLPALRDLDHVEVSTPLSTVHFANHPSGEIYGLAPTPARFRSGPGPHTKTAGLFLTGQDIWTGGVVGAALGAVLAASAITKRDLLTELAMR